MTQPLLSVSRFRTICCFRSGLFVLTTSFARLTLMFIMQLSLPWLNSSLPCALRELIATPANGWSGTVVFIIVDTSMAMLLLLLELPRPYRVNTVEYKLMSACILIVFVSVSVEGRLSAVSRHIAAG